LILPIFDPFMLHNKVFNLSPYLVRKLLSGSHIASYAYLCHTCGDLFDFDSKCTTGCPNYYRDVLLVVCGGAAALGLVVLATLAPFQIGNRRRGT
jgi:hypothetical protein